MNSKMYSLVAVSLAAGLLAGCLGDDSDSGSSGGLNTPDIETARDPVEITTATAPEAIQSVFESMDSEELDTFDALDLDDIAAAMTNQTEEQKDNSRIHWQLKKLAEWAVREQVTAAATETRTESCGSGGSVDASVTEEGDDTEGSMLMKVTFSDCVTDEFNASGQLSMDTSWTATTNNYELAVDTLKIETADDSFTMHGGIQGECTEKSDHTYCTSQSDGFSISMGEEFYRLLLY